MLCEKSVYIQYDIGEHTKKGERRKDILSVIRCK